MPYLLIYLLVISLFAVNSACSGHSETKVPSEKIIVNLKQKPGCTTESIDISQGKLCGKRINATGGERVDAYLGIPFAETTISSVKTKSDLGANCELWDSVSYELRESWWDIF